MIEKRQNRGKITAVILLLSIIFLGLTQTARADGIYIGNQVGSDETIENDAIMNGTDVMVNGTIEGDLFVVGKNITINGTVEGSLFALGENVVIVGDVEGSAYVTAVSAQLREGASIGRSLYVVGVSMVIERDSYIGRDLVAITLGARLAGGGERDTVAIVGLVEVVKWVMNAVNQVTTGKSVAFLEPGITVDTRTRSTNYRVNSQDGTEIPEAQTNESVDWALKHARMFISFLAVGILMIWWLPGLNERWADKVGERPFATFGAGLVFYIVGFLGAALLLILLIAIGVGFVALTFWGLAFMWGGITISALSLAFWFFILLVAYASKVIVAYWSGRWLLRRFVPKAQRRIWPLLLGLTILVLLIAIPYAGWAISFIVTFVGMGAVALVYLESKRAGLVTAEAE